MLTGFLECDESTVGVLIDSLRCCITLLRSATVWFARNRKGFQTPRDTGTLWVYPLSHPMLECDRERSIESQRGVEDNGGEDLYTGGVWPGLSFVPWALQICYVCSDPTVSVLCRGLMEGDAVTTECAAYLMLLKCILPLLWIMPPHFACAKTTALECSQCSLRFRWWTLRSFCLESPHLYISWNWYRHSAYHSMNTIERSAFFLLDNKEGISALVCGAVADLKYAVLAYW